MRKLIPLMLVSLLFPVAGYPLGLGEIRLHSALNQPLSAEIDLLSVAPEEESSITVGLASSEVFAKLGVDRTSSLLMLTFEVSKRPNGSFYIKAYSKQAIREPYLDFLLEVNWRSGHALREYTVLLDPPEMRQSTAVVEPPAPSAMTPEPVIPDPELDAAMAAADQEAAASGEQAAPAQEGNEATAEEPATAAADAAKGEETVAVEEPKAAESAAEAQAVPEAQPKEEQVAAAPEPAAEESVPAGPPARSGVITYGPVRSDDTLWKIARKIRPDNSTTLPQVMAALVRENPYAFYGRNANRLKAGHVLRLDPAQLAQISREEAAREIALQGRQWQDYKQQASAQAAARKPTQAPEADRSVGVATAKKDEPHLKLVTPPATTRTAKDKLAGPGTGVPDADALRQELLLAIETTEAQKQENDDLRKRLTELEGQLTNMQRLLSLKDNDLAALQRQAAQVGGKDKSAKPGVTQPPSVAAAPGAKPAAAGAAPAATTGQPGAVAPGGGSPVAVPDAGSATAPGSATVTVPGGAPVAGGAPAAALEGVPAPAPGGAPGPALEGVPAIVPGGAPGAMPAIVVTPGAGGPGAASGDSAAGGQKPAAAKKPPQTPAAAPAPAPEPESGLLSNPLFLGAMGLVVVAMLGIGVVLIRRRRSGASFQESILMGSSPSMLKAKAAEGAPKEETSFFSDFAVSGMGDIHAEDSEVDPLTEADVYMAYQRFQQAEELLRDAMKGHDRPELHVKLLEVYHATRDKAAFETEANKVNGMLGGTGPLWEKVQALGHDLLPESPLFAKAPEKLSRSEPAHSDARLDNEVLDIGLDLDALAEEMESGGAQGGGEFNLDLGVDFSDLDSGKKAAPAPAEKPAPAAAAPAPAPAAPAKAEEPIEFDLGDLSLHLDEQPAAAPSAAAKPAVATEVLDLGGLDLGGLDLDTTPAKDEGLAGVAAAGELDLSGLELNDEKPPADGGLGDFDLSELENLQLDAVPAGGQDDDALFGNLDEAGTKLDLARAYMEMGDPDGARSILDEVTKEGSATQKQQAQDLLKQIA